MFRRIARHHRSLMSMGIVTSATVALSLLAVLYPGITTADVQLNDGGVWVTKPTALLVGHLNYQAQVLDAGLRAKANDFEILQSGNIVLTHDRANATLNVIDPANKVFGADIALPPDAAVTLGADTVAILGRSTGALFALTVAELESFSVESTDPAIELGAGAAVTVGSTGTVHAVSAADRQLVTVARSTGPMGFEAPTLTELPALNDLGDQPELSIAAVGDASVVLESTSGTLFLPEDRTVKTAAGAALQQSSTGTATTAVLVATPDSLLIQPLDGGEATRIETGGAGSPIAPVFLNGCAYAAWSTSARYLRDCPGSIDDVARDLEIDTATPLTFRVNRNVVVLNDLTTGLVWLVDQDMVVIDNWNDITPPPDESDEEDDQDAVTESVENVLPQRTEENTEPVAVDDSFGVRAGRSVILPVLDNDTDADGDILTATIVGDAPSLGSVQPIFGGTALQIAVADDATATTSFRYTVSDGRGGTAEATVTLTVSEVGTNSPPVQKRTSSFVVEQGASITHNVRPDWIDPDGDDLFLQAATPADDDAVQFTADGVLSYAAVGQHLGRKDVALVVSDGVDPAEGSVRVDVRASGSTTPVTNPDHVSTTVGQTVTVSPLLNDASPGGVPLRLAKIDEVPGATIVPDFATGTFTFSAAEPRTYYLQYLATDGPNTVLGLVRIDVTDAAASDLPPVAVRDVALLPVGRDVLVDVLANDTDPAGGILVVQSLTIPDNLGITVAVLEHQVLHVIDQSGLNAPVTIGYTVSNGSLSAEGEVLVVPVPAPAKLLPPVAVDDTVTVRAGDIVSIPVLANDSHPNGDTMTLAPALVEPLVDAADGELFVSENMLRFQAGPTAKTVYATYEVVDSLGQKDSGYVTIQILALDAATNSPPRPQDLTARVLSGNTVRIPIPLGQIDPDGDSVHLVGQGSAPTKGRIVEVGDSWLGYEAFADSVGTDSFSYVVRDRLGAEAQASILVGIARPGSTNQKPYAVKDAVSARPDRQLAVPVLVNDTDPDGDALTLVADGLTVPGGLTATVNGERIVLQTPTQPGEYSIAYTVADPWGATAIGTLQLSITADAPLLTPIARDDRVAAADVADQTSVDVPVLTNDEDPDGSAMNLRVTTDNPAATVTSDGSVRVALTATAQIVRYTVTDPDDLQASAFVLVPGLEDQRPTLTTGVPAIEVKSGETVSLALDDFVTVAAGKSPRITVADKVSATHGNGDSLIQNETTLVYTSSADYFGPEALSFEVTDGTGPDDPAGHTATLAIPITVLAPDNQQPTFVGGTVEVAPGEDAVTVDLAAMAMDADPGDLEKLVFRIDGAVPAGFEAIIKGQTLSASAPSGTAKGQSGALALLIDDGTTAPVSATLQLSVIASTRPLATTTDDAVPEADQGESVTVSVLDNDTNPFPEEPLRVVSASVETGAGSASVVGSEVEVTPSGDFIGTMVVRYRVADATNDTEREVEGRIRLTVQGRPDAPSTPSVTSIQDRTVVLSWTPPSNNGAEITGYTVSASGFSQECASTTCTLTNLTNDTEYSFTVTATNTVGESDPSGASAVARPDARPDVPQPPTLAFSDGALDVSWVTPTSTGSAVSSYLLEISPLPQFGGLQRTATGNSLTWDGLENGVAYTVRVQAANRAPEPSDWSSFSSAMVPAGVPDAPAAPTTTRLDPVGSQAQMQVSWTAPVNNGDAIAGYVLTVQSGGTSRTIPVSGGTTSQAVVVDTSTNDYTFTVVASNKAGDSASSAASAARRAFVAPGAPTNVVATEGDNTVTVTYNPAAGNGATSSELSYEYNVSGTGWRTDWAATGGNGSGTIGNGQVNNNGSYTIAVRAVTQLDGQRYDGAGSTSSNSVAPFGAPNQPGAGATGGGAQVNVQWSAPGRNGRDITLLEISIDGGGWENVGVSSGNRNVGSYSQTHSINVRATDAAGQTSTKSASATSGAAPPTTWTVTVDNARSCAQDNLTNARFDGTNCNAPGYWLEANSDQTVTCWTDVSSLQVKGDYVWLRMTNTFYVSRYTLKAGQDTTIPAGMPKC
ncbi:Ig-like domain-containing protein [Cryobacterium sp. Y11]|uniref:Ig-like domain-containing protein n=1 Tax=Cryobacterium sp. Y11 TaxID=2045016 RepID=UPI000CE325D1|nr:Ig-like domain-containing protein [Cryobacterium sp. Y11]